MIHVHYVTPTNSINFAISCKNNCILHIYVTLQLFFVERVWDIYFFHLGEFDIPNKSEVRKEIERNIYNKLSKLSHILTERQRTENISSEL